MSVFIFQVMILSGVFSTIIDLISGMLPFCLLIIVGIFITVKGEFFQFKLFLKSVKLIKNALKESKKENNGISSFQAACTALSGTVGTGNIAGVAGAISIGGPGAVFWMWISALLGMAIKCVEITLSIKYREQKENNFNGGPMYYIINGLGDKFKIFGFLFAVAALPAVLCTGNITQTNSAVLTIGESSTVRWTFGIIFTLLTALVVFGGSKRIGAVTEKVVPIMSVLYIILSFGIILTNIKILPSAIFSIFKGAFSPRSVTGGVVGSVISCILTGASRGIFSNEAGLGTSAMAHSVAYDAKENTQGLYGIVEVFIDTILICTLTALTILCSGVNIEYGSISGAALVGRAFSNLYGGIANYLLSIMMFFFAFSSVVSWALYGQLCANFLFGKWGSAVFLFIYPFTCLVGALCDAQLAWRLSELFNGIMLCINLPVLLLLLENSLQYFRGNDFGSKKIRKNIRAAYKSTGSNNYG